MNPELSYKQIPWLPIDKYIDEFLNLKSQYISIESEVERQNICLRFRNFMDTLTGILGKFIGSSVRDTPELLLLDDLIVETIHFILDNNIPYFTDTPPSSGTDNSEPPTYGTIL
jgi:hypothetical protein